VFSIKINQDTRKGKEMRKLFTLLVLVIVVLSTVVVAIKPQPAKASPSAPPFIYEFVPNGFVVWTPGDPSCHEDGWILVKYAKTQQEFKLKLTWVTQIGWGSGVYRTPVFPEVGAYVIEDGEINHYKIEGIPTVLYINSRYPVYAPVVGKP
jgi:hypothetical protein